MTLFAPTLEIVLADGADSQLQVATGAPILLADGGGYTPPNNGGPDSSQGSGTRWALPVPADTTI